MALAEGLPVGLDIADLSYAVALPHIRAEEWYASAVSFSRLRSRADT